MTKTAIRSCVLLLALLVAPAARAADADLDKAKEIYGQAEKEYQLGRFDDALKLYQQAFEAKPLPGFLFNIGQCHRNLGNWERASFFYQGYLAREPKAKNRSAVLALIDQMNDKIKEAEAHKQVTPPPNPNPNPVVVAPNPNPNPVRVDPVEPRPVPVVIVPPEAITPKVIDKPGTTEDTPVYRKWWLWTIIGVAVVGGAVGVTYAALNPSVSTEGFNGTLGGPIDASH